MKKDKINSTVERFYKLFMVTRLINAGTTSKDDQQVDCVRDLYNMAYQILSYSVRANNYVLAFTISKEIDRLLAPDFVTRDEATRGKILEYKSDFDKHWQELQKNNALFVEKYYEYIKSMQLKQKNACIVQKSM